MLFHISQHVYVLASCFQVDYIFQEVAREANMSRVQLAQYAVEDTKRGVVRPIAFSFLLTSVFRNP
jgi:hypothetical protein